MKVIPIQMPNSHGTWCVIDDNKHQVASIFQYLSYLYNLQKSPNTIRAYAYHLKHFWQYLTDSNLQWQKVKIDHLAGFITWLRSPSENALPIHQFVSKRTESTINTTLAAVTAFYKFHEQLGNVAEIDLYSSTMSISSKYKPFLNHLNSTRLTKTRILKIKVPFKLPKIIDRPSIERMLEASYYIRDKFLICLLHETGMRVGQLLGLRHSDILSWDNEIHLIPRNLNENGSRSKTKNPNILHVSSSLMKLYTKYMLTELEDIESEYVFVCLKGQKRGKPLRYTAIQDLFKRLSETLLQKVTPHMLRHTHATELIQQGWDMALVQKRLGHLNIQTTVNIYTHLTAQDLKNALKKYETRSLADEIFKY